jgi:MFS family permease
MLGAGTLLIGVSFGIYYPEFYMLMGKAAPVSLTAMGMSLIMVGYDLGGFISPYFYSLLAQVTGQEGIRFPFIFSMIAFVVIAVIMGLGARKQPATENVKPDLAAEEKSTP